MSIDDAWKDDAKTSPAEQSRRHGGFGGLSPPNKAPSSPNWNVKHYK